MRNQLHWTWGAALVWGVLCGPLLAEPVGKHITMKIDMEDSTDYKNIAGSTARSKEQHRQLNVTLDNRDKEPAADVSVKWAIYSRKMDSHKLVTVKQGTTKARIEALSTTSVKSDKVTIKGTPRHTVVTRKSVKGKVQNNSKTEPATGEEYYGYAVAVYAGTVLIDEVFSQPSLKLTK